MENNNFIPENYDGTGEGKTEGRIQAECFKWFNNNFPALRGLLYHVPNGGLKNRKESGQLLAMGVVAGVPDLEFHFHRRTFFLECKTPTGTVSPDQKKIHSVLDDHGFHVFVFRSLNEFQTIIWAIIQDKSVQFGRGMTKADFEYRNGIFQYIYGLKEGEVQIIDDLVEESNRDKFKGYVFEFMTDCLDKIEGFEILFTSDYKGFYKRNLDESTPVYYKGYTTENIPNERK